MKKSIYLIDLESGIVQKDPSRNMVFLLWEKDPDAYLNQWFLIEVKTPKHTNVNPEQWAISIAKDQKARLLECRN